MPEAETGKAVRLLDLLLGFFADDQHWTRHAFDDGAGRHCLVGAVRHLSARYRLPARPVLSLLEAALPERQLGLIRYNDDRCLSAAELRSIILRARHLAFEHARHERAADELEQRLLAEIEKQRAVRAVSGDKRKIHLLALATAGAPPAHGAGSRTEFVLSDALTMPFRGGAAPVDDTGRTRLPRFTTRAPGHP